MTLDTIIRAPTATNHAKTCGLYPKNGTIAVGGDIALRRHRRHRLASVDNGTRQVCRAGGKLVGKLGGGDYVAREKSKLAAS